MRQFKACMEVFDFLGFKTSAKKVSEPAPSNIVLGLQIDCLATAIRCGEERAADLVARINTFAAAPEKHSTADLEALVGKLSFLAYHHDFAQHYMMPLYALKWMPPSHRGFVVSKDPSAVGARTRAALGWWLRLLKGDRILWTAKNEPTHWHTYCSDSSSKQFGSYDSKGQISVGDFADTPWADEIIAFKELYAITEHLRIFPAEQNSGLYLVCDNMNVVHTMNRRHARGSQQFRLEYAEFHEHCELHGIQFVATYCASKDNLPADMLSRGKQALAISMLSWMGVPPSRIVASKSIYKKLMARNPPP